MKETKKEEVKKNTNETKKVQKVKLSPAATVLLTIAASLGIIVLIVVIYAIFMAL